MVLRRKILRQRPKRRGQRQMQTDRGVTAGGVAERCGFALRKARRCHHDRGGVDALLRDEIASQLAAFRSAFGQPPDYIDGHQHIHVFPQIGEALLRVVKSNAPGAWIRQCSRPASAHKSLADPKGLILDALSRRFRRLAGQQGVPTNPAFAGTYSFRPGADFAKLFPQFLDGLPEGGVVMCHPGKVDAELRRLDPLTELREREYAYLLGKDFPRVMAAHGVVLS